MAIQIEGLLRGKMAWQPGKKKRTSTRDWLFGSVDSFFAWKACSSLGIWSFPCIPFAFAFFLFAGLHLVLLVCVSLYEAIGLDGRFLHDDFFITTVFREYNEDDLV
ncbi:hypothetical protein BC940DRAFT_288724 [Gongronella butleri]|nr:hypothetical protein BC940DRAFT_288724 [Gongronella butleri]